MADLERADTFSLDRAQTFTVLYQNQMADGITFTTPYNQMNDDPGILDEERVNWTRLLTRVLSFFLLFVVIVMCGLYEISPKFLVLAAIVCVVLIITIVATYVDLRPYFCFLCRRRSPISNSNKVLTIAAMQANQSTDKPSVAMTTPVNRAELDKRLTFTDETLNPIQI
ncbi:hypothetical protein EON65_01065 [archaeon]|nr:MAG: hypothetical protein EON65_01065 [archaeon]